MARKASSPKIDTRTARTKLRIRAEPYWARIEKGRFLGYRPSRKRGEGNKGGNWIGRYRGPDGKQHYEALGTADDVSDPDGHSIFSFDQAQEMAREWFKETERKLAGDDAPKGPYTVSTAITSYLAWLESEGKATAQDARTRARALILPNLGEIEISMLTADQIRQWRDQIAKSPARLRSGIGKDQQFRGAPDTEEAQRKRKATANRTLTILKGALNHAFGEGEVASDDVWRRVKPFKGVDAARVRFLTIDECKRLINASALEFRRLVHAALLTGTRYSELAGMRVRDFHPNAGTVFVARSKSGKARHVVLTEEGAAHFTAWTTGRAGDDLMFSKESGEPWRKSNQARPLAEACSIAKIEPAVTFHELRHTYASLAIMSGMSLMVLATNLGHSDSRMVEKHYGHLDEDYKVQMIRATAPRFGIAEEGKVVPIVSKR